MLPIDRLFNVKQEDNTYLVITDEYFVNLLMSHKNGNPRKDVFVHKFPKRSYLYKTK